MKETIKTIVITFIGFVLYFFAQRYLLGKIIKAIYQVMPNNSLAYLIANILIGLPIFASVVYLHGFKGFFKGLGLDQSLFKGLIFAFITTLPMLIAYALMYPLNKELDARMIIMGAVGAAFFEELYFRGFFFGQIFRKTRLGFISAILLPSLIFASLHLYQGQGLSHLSGIFLTTFIGSAWFAWLFVEWNYNLWIPIFLHLLMNFYWMLFSAGDDALGGWTSNIFRVMTIAFVMIGSIYYKKKKSIPYIIRKKKIL